MKKLLNLLIFTFFISFSSLSQWHYCCHINIPFIPEFTTEYKNAIFINDSTGYYCYTSYAPTPSSANSIYVKKTTNNCESWSTDFFLGECYYVAKAVKYFKPFIYFLWNFDGSLMIEYKKEGENWKSLNSCGGYYIDFFAHDTSNYKVLSWYYKLYVDSNFVTVQYFKNNNNYQTDTFLTYTPKKMWFPLDTVGIFLCSSSFSSNKNTLIVKYTPSTGYNIVYQDTNQNFSDIYFPSPEAGYITGDSGIVLYTNNLGDTWQIRNTGFNTKLNSVFFITNNSGYVVGNSGLILKTNDYGATWYTQFCPIKSSLTKVYFLENSLVGFIFSGLTVLKTTNGGDTWLYKTNDLNVYPNPATNSFKIKIPDDFKEEEALTLFIYDSAGKLVQQSLIYKPYDKLILENKNFKGLYNIVLSNGSKRYTGKIVFN